MAILTNTPRYLNLDNDDRILQPSEMSDALNVRVSADEGGDQGVIKNIAGNSVLGQNLGHNLQGSTNKVVGTYEHEGTNRFFVFIYGNTGTHSIYELEQSSNSLNLIIQSTNIEMSGDELHINGVVIDDDLFLYFTDGVSEPQRVNADTSVSVGSYPASKGEATVIKVAPLAPSVSFETDNNRETNDILGKSFQFALQYVYADGEVSAIGEYSANLCAPNTLIASVNTPNSEDNNFNKIKVSHNSILGYNSVSIPKVRVYFRDVTDQTLFKVGEYGYNEITTGIDFYNDGVYPVVSDNEYNKLQDAVPRSAKSQTITANRLFYGNYVEGFNKASVSATLSANYSDESVGTSLSMADDTGTNTIVNLNTTAASSLIGTGDDVNLIIDYTLASNSLGYYNVNTPPVNVYVKEGTSTVATVNTNFQIRVPKGSIITKNVIVSNPSSASDFNTKLAAELDGLQFTLAIPASHINYTSDWAFKWEGFVVVELSATATSTGVQIENDVVAYNVAAQEVRERTGSGTTPSDYTIANNHSATLSGSGVTTSVTGFAISDSNTIAYIDNLVSRTFKSSESHSIGVVFEDEYGRTTGVYELGSVEIEDIGSRASGSRGAASIDVTLSVSGLDPDLTKYFYVYGGGSSIQKYLQFGVTEAVTAISDAAKESFSEDSIFVSLRSIEGKGQSINSRGGALDTGFSKGDKLRILAYDDSGRVYPQGYVFDVAGVYTTENEADLSGETDFQSKGKFLVLENANYEGFGAAYVGTSQTLWENNVLVEVYTPKKENETRIYRAISQKYNTKPPISNIGQVQNLDEGNAWYKRRHVQYKGGANRLVSDYEFVESQQYSDLNSLSKGTLGGKPYAVIENERENHRISSITYSDPQLIDSGQNNLSSFNNSLANFSDYEMNYGGIYGLVDMSDSIMILQSDKVSRIPVSRNILSTASGQDFVTQTTEILGLQRHYSGNFGINEDRTAYLKSDGVVYIVDVTRSKIVSLTEQGTKILSDLNISSWVESRCDEMLAAQGYSVSIGHDKKNSEIVFSLQDSGTTYHKSIVYSISLNKFCSFVDYTSDFYGNQGNRFFQVRGRDVYEAETNSSFGTFFGVQKDSYFEVCFNQSPSSRKAYQAFSIDGTSSASLSITTDDQSATLAEGAFVKKEGAFFVDAPRAAGSSEYVTLGEVSAESDPEITFTSKVNRLPFKLGGDAYTYANSVYTQLSGCTVDGAVNSKTLSFTNGGAISVGDIIAIKSDSGIDGDSLRGSFAKVKFTFDDTNSIEIFAVSASVANSPLHSIGSTQQ